MKNTNAVPAVVLKNNRRFLEFLKDHVGSEDKAAAILREAYVLARDPNYPLKDEEKMSPWLCGVMRMALEGKPYKREGIDRDLRQTVSLCIDHLLPALKPDQAELIEKAELKETSLKTLAHHDRTSPEDIKARLHRAREALKKKMLQSWGVCAVHSSMDCSCHR